MKSLSGSVDVSSGVPQESVLDPTLFNVILVLKIILVLIVILVFKIILVMILILVICFSYDFYSSSQNNLSYNFSSRDNFSSHFSSRKFIIS